MRCPGCSGFGLLATEVLFNPHHGLLRDLRWGGKSLKVFLKILFIVLVLTAASSLAFGQDNSQPPQKPSTKAQKQQKDADKQAQPAPVVTPSPAPKSAPKKPSEKTMIVFNIISERGVDRGLSRIVTEVVLDRAFKAKVVKVIGQKDLDKMLSWEESKQLQGCTDTGCLIRLAGALGADYYFEGSIGPVGDSYVITLKLMDAFKVEVLDRTTLTVKRDENIIVKTVENAVDDILHKSFAAIKAKTDLSVVSPPMTTITKTGIGLLAGGVGVAAIGGVFSFLSSKAADDYKNAKTPQEVVDADQNRKVYNGVSIGCYVVGGAAAITGAVLWGLDATGKLKKNSLSIAPIINPAGGGIAIGGQW